MFFFRAAVSIVLIFSPSVQLSMMAMPLCCLRPLLTMHKLTVLLVPCLSNVFEGGVDIRVRCGQERCQG
jgi:hypothetical protein